MIFENCPHPRLLRMYQGDIFLYLSYWARPARIGSLDFFSILLSIIFYFVPCAILHFLNIRIFDFLGFLPLFYRFVLENLFW